MKISLYTKTDEIGIEINRIMDTGTQLFCLRDKTNPVPLKIQGKTKTQNNTLLVLQHPKKEICPQKKCFFYYHVKEKPMRCFHCIPDKQVKSLLAVNYPKEIFEVQRRKFPRIKAWNDSSVSFSLAGKQKIHNGKIIDVCMEGAKISGDFSIQMSAGDIIAPLSMTLLFRLMKNEEAHVHIPEATVVRSDVNEHGTKEFSIHFSLPVKLQDPLARYVDMRRLEEMDRAEKHDHAIV